MTAPSSEQASSRPSWSRRIAITLISIILLLAAAWYTVTDSAPTVEQRPPPNAGEVGGARDTANQLRAGRLDPQGRSRIELGRAQLDGIAALASHGFRPDRLAVEVQDGTVSVRGSHRLPGGRWLNAGMDTAGGGSGFPPIRLYAGAVTLDPFLSRVAIQAGRLLLRLRGVDLPPLDAMVNGVAVGRDRVTATLSLPSKTGLFNGLASATHRSVDPKSVVDIYCRLARQQAGMPVTTLPALIHRTFAASDTGVALGAYNRAAFIALAMLVVDDRAGDLAGTARTGIDSCRIAPITVTLQGRADLAKHWTLSAALAAGAGTQLSEAMGEWKELADSLDAGSQFAIGDPTGFSFADLSADRSGFRVSHAGIGDDDAVVVAAWLRDVTEAQLLPEALTVREDGITNADFVRRYGSLSDPRFAARVAEIDRTLDQAGVPAQE